MDAAHGDRRGESSGAHSAGRRPTPRRTTPAALGWALACALFFGGAGCAEAPPRPNVVMIVIDTVRTDHLSVYGYPWETTPNLEALAARGVVFDDCVAQSSWTMPSMLSLMTGKPIFRSIWRVPDEMPLLAESFDAAGYATGGIVANSVLAAEAGYARGFDVYEVRQKGRRQWKATDVTRKALKFLEAVDDRPFFLWLHYLDPHAPYSPPVVPWTRPLEEVFEPFELQAMETGIARAPEAERLHLSLQRELAAAEVDRYDGELRALDASLGQVLQALDDLDLSGDTYVAVLGDHGESLFRRPQHPARTAELRAWRAERNLPMRLEDYVKKEHNTYVYEELVRTPFLLAGPGLEGGRRSDALVSNLDVFPTLLGLCGLEHPVAGGAEAFGRDLSAGLLAGEPVPSAPYVTTATDAMMAARLPDGRKLIVPYAGQRERYGFAIEWFDLDQDPFELQPRPLDDEARELLERLRDFRRHGPFASWGGRGMDPDTVERLRELGYIR